MERQQEDEDEAGDGRQRQEDPEEDEVDLLSQQLPVAEGVVDGLVLLLLLRHLEIFFNVLWLYVSPFV